MTNAMAKVSKMLVRKSKTLNSVELVNHTNIPDKMRQATLKLTEAILDSFKVVVIFTISSLGVQTQAARSTLYENHLT